MKRTITLLTAMVVVFGLTGVAHATFIGDNVLIEHHCCTTIFGDVWDSHSVLVQAGNSDRTLVTAHTDFNPTYGVDVEASSFYVDFVRNTNFTAGNPYHGVVVSDMDWLGTPGIEIIGASVVTNFGGWSNSNLSFGSNWVSLDWQGMNVPNGSYFDVTIQTGGTSAPIPEPGTLLLLGSGLVGLAGFRKKFKNN